MSRLIKILHIDPDYQTTYLIYRERSSIRTSVPLEKAIALLKNEDFDLIISEPHHKAILKKEPYASKSEPVWLEGQSFGEAPIRAASGQYGPAGNQREEGLWRSSVIVSNPRYDRTPN